MPQNVERTILALLNEKIIEFEYECSIQATADLVEQRLKKTQIVFNLQLQYVGKDYLLINYIMQSTYLLLVYIICG